MVSPFSTSSSSASGSMILSVGRLPLLLWGGGGGGAPPDAITEQSVMDVLIDYITVSIRSQAGQRARQAATAEAAAVKAAAERRQQQRRQQQSGGSSSGGSSSGGSSRAEAAAAEAAAERRQQQRRQQQSGGSSGGGSNRQKRHHKRGITYCEQRHLNDDVCGVYVVLKTRAFVQAASRFGLSVN